MPFYVLLEVETEDEAKELVTGSAWQESVLVTTPHKTVEGASNTHKVYVKPRGVYRKPTKFCDASDGHRGGHKTYQGWSRGKKWGWMVCAKCGKPTEAWASGKYWFSALGRNLLPFSKLANEPRDWPEYNEWVELLDLLGGKPE
jgi:hypothetical protein